MRVLIADDHEIVRRGLKRTLLEEFPFAYIEEAGDTTQLIEKAILQRTAQSSPWQPPGTRVRELDEEEEA